MPYSSLNRVVLIGRLTRDPELRALPSGGSVCALRIACNSSRRDPDGGYTEKPNYFDVNVYGASGESVSQYMRKGSRVGIDGRLDWREWETADQQRRQAVSGGRRAHRRRNRRRRSRVLRWMHSGGGCGLRCSVARSRTSSARSPRGFSAQHVRKLARREPSRGPVRTARSSDASRHKSNRQDL